MLDFFRKLFFTDFMPHVYCLREPGIVKLHIVSDAIIALSYALIPLALVILIRRRGDLVFPWMFSLFGVFILGCGLTHVMAIVTLWHPAYRLDGLLKAVTGAASFATAVLLFRLLPDIEALPSPVQLQVEVKQRRQAESDLRDLNESLEKRVAERTAALETANRELAQSNRRLAESEERFRTLAEAVPNLLWSTDANGSCTYASPRYEEYTGMPLSKLLADGWKAVVHPEDKARVAAAWQKAVETGLAYEVEYRLRRFDGRYCWFVARAVPMRDANREITQWMGSSTDIQQLKHTEGALLQSIDELNQFAYAAAHDLQEPLRNVANLVGMLNRSYRAQLGETAAQWMDWTIEGAQRMHQMVQDLLSYSKAVNLGTDRPDSLIPAEAAVRLALQNLADGFNLSDATIEIGQLPHLNAYEGQLVQLFQNLIENSLKYRRPNSRPLIYIAAERKGADWQFSVKDNGIGFSAEYADNIFGVFKRLHSRSEYSGNGIGLAICARIVRHYGGRVWAEGLPGKGASFHFTFPAEQDTDDNLTTEQNQHVRVGR